MFTIFNINFLISITYDQCESITIYLMFYLTIYKTKIVRRNLYYVQVFGGITYTVYKYSAQPIAVGIGKIAISYGSKMSQT